MVLSAIHMHIDYERIDVGGELWDSVFCDNVDFGADLHDMDGAFDVGGDDVGVVDRMALLIDIVMTMMRMAGDMRRLRCRLL